MTAGLRRAFAIRDTHAQVIIPVACRTHEGTQRLLAAITARASQADALAPALKRRALIATLHRALAAFDHDAVCLVWL